MQAILALDLCKAFDNVTHDPSYRISKVRIVARECRDFLPDHSITLTLGPYELSIQQPPNRGTPQVSILSPTLFNLAMKGLLKMLARIPGVKHAIYADDITI
ncbi:hypothetical protein HPB48_021044 [Haemaphysalis longicornis]|uniref:Reverse transcriptase domain-containing protein n=1 Tax=Haemaphysalis longicornis TaxID=44386 RepID=A0A9J6GA97_HAELO|nr:hypothetical protein HPB48_021044 [Haemaphysalis longicornis]